ncbi:MAG: hypothetical protein IJX93_10905 [Clostridia bacterium]|nr:hypothetical protein [Clostridia bacterium]MBQ8334267.1 hypothetical protein [Clostridia bacterium]MBQ8513387.1 hypothetical protein [Clostridia bacterium]
MLTPKRLIAEYEFLSDNPCPRIRMPVKQLTRDLAEIYLWLTLAVLLCYSVMTAASVFIWIYVPFTVYLYARVWDLYGLSVKKLIAACAVFFALSIPSGILLRRGILMLFEILGIF